MASPSPKCLVMLDLPDLPNTTSSHKEPQQWPLKTMNTCSTTEFQHTDFADVHGERELEVEPTNHKRKPRWTKAVQVFVFVLALSMTFVVPSLPLGFGPEEYKGKEPAARCLGVVVTVSILWATDVIPAYITALMIPVLVVTRDLLCVPRHIQSISEEDTLLVPASYCNSTKPEPGDPMEPNQAVVVATGAFFNPVVLLFLSGFTMSVVLDKYKISSRIATWLLSSGGPSRRILAVLMIMSILSSSILSNVPAAVIVTALVTQTFDSTQGTSWGKASLLSVAYSCNIGGMASPIASPQNVIALIAMKQVSRGEISISFLDWLKISIPFCLVAFVCCWLFLVFYFRKTLPAVIDPLRASLKNNANVHLRNMACSNDGVKFTATTSATSTIGSVNNNTITTSNHNDEEEEEEDTTNTNTNDNDNTDDNDNNSSNNNSQNDDGDSVTARLLSNEDISDPAYEVPRVAVKKMTSCWTTDVTLAEVVICTTVLATVVVWVFFYKVEHVFGNIGIVALIPIIVFGSFGYLEQADFNGLSWDTLMLMGGGLSLGTAVDSSGLLSTIGEGMTQFTQDVTPQVVLLTFSTLVAILANVISSTVAASLLFPVIAAVGIEIGHPKMLVVLCAIMTSGAMGLPVSSFPNANAKAQQLVGQRKSILSNIDFVKTGAPVSLLILFLVNTFGYGLATAYGW